MFSSTHAGFSMVRQAGTVILAVCLLSSPTPTAPQTIVSIAKESFASLAFWYDAGGLRRLFQGQRPGNAPGQEKQSDRDAKVSRLQIFPHNVTVDLSDHVRFNAVAYDATGNSVG